MGGDEGAVGPDVLEAELGAVDAFGGRWRVGLLDEPDGTAGVDCVWIRPADGGAEAEAGRRTIIFPTLMNVQKLGRSTRVAEAVDAARSAPIVTVLPTLVDTDAGQVMRLPADAGYDVVEAPVEQLR